MVSGTSIAQAALLLATPLLTRLYSPNDFGVLGIFVTTIGVMSVISCGRYEFAILIPKNHKDAVNLLVLSLGLCLISVALIFCSLFFFKDSLERLLTISNDTEIRWLIGLSVLAAGSFQTFNFWCTRQKQFRRIAISRLSQSVVTIVCQIIFAVFLNLQDIGLVVGYVLGQTAAAGILAKFIWSDDKSFIFNNFSFSGMILQARLHKKFPLFNSWPSLIDSLRVALPVMVLSKFFGVTVTGYYSLATRVLWLPSSLIGQSISQVLFQRIAEEHNKTGKTSAIIEKTFMALALLALPYFAIMLLSPFYFEIIFGSGWKIPGIYAMILAPATALMFIVSPLSIAPSACYRQEISALWQLSAIIITAISLFSSLTLNSPEGTLITLSLNNVMLYSIYGYLIFRITHARFRNLIFTRHYKNIAKQIF